MQEYSFHILDGVAIAVIIASAFFALIRGFVTEVLGIFSWILATFVALYLQESTFPFWHKMIRNEVFAHIVSFTAPFLVTLVLGHVLTYRVAHVVEEGALGSLDRSLGFLFGIVRGGVIMSLFYILVSSFSDVKEGEKVLPSWMEGAKTVPLMQEGATFLVSLLPKDMEKDAEKSAKLDKDIKEKIDKGDDFSVEKPESVETPKKGYGDKERKNMDSLIESVQ